MTQPDPRPTEGRLDSEMHEAEAKAWDSLARYKFWMFGYWAALWVHLNRISGSRRPNPWADLVRLAREKPIAPSHQKPRLAA